MTLLDQLQQRVLVCDGAMGTRLYAKGIFINRCFDELNLSAPHLVGEIHAEYVEAGADILETNTFGANRFKLEPYGLAEKLPAILSEGVRLAREAAGSDRLVAGAIGPLGSHAASGDLENDEVVRIYHEMVKILSGAGADFILFETFRDMREMRLACEAARSACDLPVALQAAPPADEMDWPAFLARYLDTVNLVQPDVVGCNCGTGPRGMLTCLEDLQNKVAQPLSMQPNAGDPQVVEGRTLYLATPEYIAEFSRRMIQQGARIVGGCCGTGPDHTRAVREAVRSLQPVSPDGRPAPSIEVVQEAPEGMEPVPVAERSTFASKLGKQYVAAVELDPPRGLDPSRTLESARRLKEAGVDAINIADGPRATARMSPMALATMIMDQVGVEPIVHMCCRDRNVIGMQADLIGAHALGVHNILAVTGDPPKLGNYDYATGVFDVDAIGLVRIIQLLNRGLDLARNPLNDATRFLVGVGANPGALNLEQEVDRFKQKVDAGAEYAMTQPVYTFELLERFLEKTAAFRIPTLVGILPLASARNADFLHNEVPGMAIPEPILKRMHEAEAGEGARAEGIRIAQEALVQAKTVTDGVYVMPPFGRVDLAMEVISAVR